MSNNLPDVVNIENGKNKRWCFFIPKGWRNYCNAKIEEVCAFQYKTMNEAILDAKKKFQKNNGMKLVMNR
ncbi:hypothetical protein [methane-oxidizing endosymbiont of Gigantopelta aegis]|uniref:hypothetical protein n=1 Tax=methane-oxidizing endosymbiont of Gigantopelta aegis TaxID=2794938 RepID=UPI001BE47CFC|nr:hypothetical protein [methane-oxidizing endosymbiont of Gigantopelta aegis]